MREIPPLLAFLRDHTASLHARLEQTPCMGRLSAPDLAAQDLAQALTVLHTGFGHIEPLLCEQTWYRPQAVAIAADLARLPWMPPPPQIPFAAPRNAAGQLGAAYVLVGSRLGARAITARLRERLGTQFISDSRYYGQEAAYAAEQWQLLLAHLRIETAQESAAEAAAAVFDYFIKLSLSCGST